MPSLLRALAITSVITVAACAPPPGSTEPSPTRIGPTEADLGPDSERLIQRIAIGACLLDAAGGAALADIDVLDPDLMLWLGDNIYADVMRIEGDMEGLRHLYRQLGRNERFRTLAAGATLMATWDDHDYGRNDAGEEWVFKNTAKREFLAFWGDGGNGRSR